MELGSPYIEELQKRQKESKAYTRHQLLGLEISQILSDEKHKSLYIKLAKEGNANDLIALAKRIAEKGTIKNKGAYFMRVLQSQKNATNRTTKR